MKNLVVAFALGVSLLSACTSGQISNSNLSGSNVFGVLPIGNGGTSGATAASGFANLSPMTTKGDLISFSTVPARVAVGATGQLLIADSTATPGVSWSYDHVGIPGGTSAVTGYVGETMTVSRVRSAGIGLSTCTTGATGPTNATNVAASPVTLTAGDWDCSAQCGFKMAATTQVSGMYCGVSATSGAMPGVDVLAVPTSGEARSRFSTTDGSIMFVSGDWTQSIPSYQVTVAAGATLPLYLVANASFTTSTMTAHGLLQCRRQR